MFHLNDPATDKKLVAGLALAWERLQARLDKMKMKPEPRPVDVSPEAIARRKKLAQASESSGSDSVDPSKKS